VKIKKGPLPACIFSGHDKTSEPRTFLQNARSEPILKDRRKKRSDLFFDIVFLLSVIKVK